MAEQATKSAADVAVSPPPSGNPVRLVVRIILFGILAYLLCALPYDYLVARAGEEKAWNQLQELLENNNTRAGRPDTTDEVVHEKLSRQPSSSKKHENGEVHETYSWRGGLPWRTYNIYVTYYPSRDKKDPSKIKLMLANAHRNETPDQIAADLPKPPKAPAGDLPLPGEPVGVGAGPGGQAGPPGARPAGPPGGFAPPGGLAPPPGAGPPGGIGGPGRPARAGTRPDAEKPADKEAQEKSETEEAPQSSEPKPVPEKPADEKSADEEKKPEKESEKSPE